ncbi:MAG: tetratricopeptide repeat protein [Puniceicoccales bacterium]|jgi:predicted Zn-dependent protease|nr:tetratricopeptide repeat protein [Puniceicoccales bacterium]
MENLDSEKQEEMARIAQAIVDGTFDVKEYYGLNDASVEAIYAVGHEFYRNKKYTKALQIFSMLCFIDNKSKRFYYACGATAFMMKQYAYAEFGYRAALTVGDYSPNLFMRLAEACLAQNKIQEGKEYLEEVLRLSKLDEFKNDEFTEQALGRATIILERLENVEVKDGAEQVQQGENQVQQGENAPEEQPPIEAQVE